MKVSVIGAGPAGLFFSALLKRRDTDHEITVYEQNSPNTTYGFGVGFSKAALNFLEQADPKLHENIIASSEFLECLAIVHKGERISISGNDFYGIERLCLLNLLKKEALANGVQIIENKRIETLNNLEKCDLIVGADGINSVVRNTLSHRFQPVIKQCKNQLIWYATSRISEGIELIFKKTDVGLFIGHTYRYKNNRNTFVVECGSSTWHAAGLDNMSDIETHILRKYIL
jgi:anthraniloyl-CoA monooxygenase